MTSVLPPPPLLLLLLLLLLAVVARDGAGVNVVLLNVDDLGYGDLGCYGHPTIKTPHIDALAASGSRWTQFYSAADVCSPSRAALLTGRYAVRSGLAGLLWTGGVLTASASGGLPANETTLAALLQRHAGYRTFAVGKWHLGQLPAFMPRAHGFDGYYGIPFSNDMSPSAWAPERVTYGLCTALPLVSNETVVEQPANLATIAARYTDEALRFMGEAHAAAAPFFLYLAYNNVHTPNFCDAETCGESSRGAYGDSVVDVDKSVGRIVAFLRDNGDLLQDTIVYLTSDNGPWLPRGVDGGSAGLLREGKATTWEGGFRVPMIISWPGTVPAGRTISGVGTLLDVFTTTLAIAGVPLPTDRAIDGKDLRELLLNGDGDNGNVKAVSPWHNEAFFYYHGTPSPSDPVNQPGLWSARLGDYKLHWVTIDAGAVLPDFHDPPLLFNLEVDPSEKYALDTALPEYAAIVQAITEARIRHEASVIPVANQARDSDPDNCLCCDPDSQDKYPDMPKCTCNPEYWTLP